MTAQTLGIDFAWARPDPAAVWGAGYRFVMGYLSAGGSKDLTAASIAAYRAAGLQVGLVWETTANRALSDAAGGAADGAAAEAEANAVGYPADCVIFAAVDFAATVAQIDGPIRNYMLAFSAATRRPVGVYGSYDVVSRICTPGQAPVAYAWQTMAWSGGRLWQPGHLFQRLSHTYSIAGSPVTDWDEDVLLNPLPLHGANVPAPNTGGDMPTPDDLFNAPLFTDNPGTPQAQVVRLRDFFNELRNQNNNVYAAMFNGGPSMKDDGKSISQSLADINAGVTAAKDPQALADAVVTAMGSEFAQKVIDALGQRINATAPPA